MFDPFLGRHAIGTPLLRGSELGACLFRCLHRRFAAAVDLDAVAAGFGLDAVFAQAPREVLELHFGLLFGRAFRGGGAGRRVRASASRGEPGRRAAAPPRRASARSARGPVSRLCARPHAQPPIACTASELAEALAPGPPSLPPPGGGRRSRPWASTGGSRSRFSARPGRRGLRGWGRCRRSRCGCPSRSCRRPLLCGRRSRVRACTSRTSGLLLRA